MINYSSSLPQLISPLENKKQINIQFLRAFAALLVVFYHTADHFFVTGGSQSGNIFTHLSGEEPSFKQYSYIFQIVRNISQGCSLLRMLEVSKRLFYKGV